MKIAYIVIKGLPYTGGIEKYTEEIGTRLVKRGHEVFVYTMSNYGNENDNYEGMTINSITTIRNKSFEKMTASFLSSIHQVKDKMDIIHFHAFGPSMFCFIPKLFGKKVIVQGHGIEWKRSRWSNFGNLILKFTEYPSVRLPNYVTVVSKVQQAYLKRKYNIKSMYIPTGVNYPKLEKPNLIKEYGLYGNDYILFAARLVKEKGAHHLIEAFKKINTDLKLVIAGDSSYEDSYKLKLLNQAKSNKNIIFTGLVTGKLFNELFSNPYFFVLPSEIEGLPIALLEAMSYSNCCLVSDIPENLEALSGYGYSFKNKNIEDLSQKIYYLINNEDVVDGVKENAKRYVLSKYSWDNIALKFENLYEKCMNK